MAKVVVVANLSAASTISVKDIRDKFAATNTSAKVIPFSKHYKHDITNAIRNGAEKVIAAGGDGTVNAVANEIYRTEVAFGVIPLGTLNHFAKDSKIPENIDDAIACIVQGHTKKVDVGLINHHVFVNNSSIGMYPQFVREREKRQSLISKWPAALLAAIKAASSTHNHAITLRVNGKTLRRRTPFVFIGNNKYDVGGKGPMRPRLNSGKIHIYILRTQSILAIVRILARIFNGARPPKHDFEEFTTQKITIASKKPHLRVALDGEIMRLSTPLHYSSEQGALNVIIPPA